MPGRGAVIVETLARRATLLGWSWLLPPYRWHFDARALDPVRAIAFDGACLRGKCDADPALGYELMQRFAQVMVERLQATRLRLLDVYGHGRRSLSRAREPDAMVPVPFRVAARRQETADTWTLELEPPRRGARASPRASSRCSTRSAWARCRSRSAATCAPGRLVTRSARSARSTRARSAPREPGDVLGVRGPFGTAWPVEAAEGADVVLVAGGIGLAPLRPASTTCSPTASATARLVAALRRAHARGAALHAPSSSAGAAARRRGRRHRRQRRRRLARPRRRGHRRSSRAPPSTPSTPSRWSADPR